MVTPWQTIFELGQVA